MGKKAGGSEPPEKSVPKAHATLLRSKAHLTHMSYLVPWLLQENFRSAAEVSVREQEVKSRRLRKQVRRRVLDWQEVTTPDTESSPVLYRDTFWIVCTR